MSDDRERAARKRKRERNASDHQRRLRRRKGLVEHASERKVLFPIRIPEGVLGRIIRLTHEGIAKGTRPWKTPAETIRALLVRGLETLKGDPTVNDMLPYLELQKQFDGIGSSRREAQASMSRASVEISELLGIEAKREALQYYHVTLQAAQEMPPTVWRDWLVEELRHKFPELQKQAAPSVSLQTVTEPESKRKLQRKVQT
jgi:hypothetical protein